MGVDLNVQAEKQVFLEGGWSLRDSRAIGKSWFWSIQIGESDCSDLSWV